MEQEQLLEHEERKSVLFWTVCHLERWRQRLLLAWRKGEGGRHIHLLPQGLFKFQKAGVLGRHQSRGFRIETNIQAAFEAWEEWVTLSRECVYKERKGTRQSSMKSQGMTQMERDWPERRKENRDRVKIWKPKEEWFEKKRDGQRFAIEFSLRALSSSYSRKEEKHTSWYRTMGMGRW